MTLKSILEHLFGHGFFVVLAATFLLFSVSTEHFLSSENTLNILHTMAPLAIIASGLGLVIISGRLDISIGSTAFL